MTTDAGLRPRALIVEDDDLLRELLSAVAVDLGCRVVACADPREGVKEAGRGWFDLIVSDVRLPGAPDGFLYRELAARNPDQAARVVFVTGDLMNPETRAFIGESGRPAIAKPFGLPELKRCLSAVLADRTCC